MRTDWRLWKGLRRLETGQTYANNLLQLNFWVGEQFQNKNATFFVRKLVFLIENDPLLRVFAIDCTLKIANFCGKRRFQKEKRLKKAFHCEKWPFSFKNAQISSEKFGFEGHMEGFRIQKLWKMKGRQMPILLSNVNNDTNSRAK